MIQIKSIKMHIDVVKVLKSEPRASGNMKQFGNVGAHWGFPMLINVPLLLDWAAIFLSRDRQGSLGSSQGRPGGPVGP